MKKQVKDKILTQLLSGKHPQAKKYAGHHVMVINNEIIPLKEGAKGVQDIQKLETKYGKTPTLVFVPRQDISYILALCLK